MKVPAAESSAAGWCSARPEPRNQQPTAAAGIAPLGLYFRLHISCQFTAAPRLRKLRWAEEDVPVSTGWCRIQTFVHRCAGVRFRVGWFLVSLEGVDSKAGVWERDERTEDGGRRTATGEPRGLISRGWCGWVSLERCSLVPLASLSHAFVNHLVFPPWFSTDRLLLDLPPYDVVHPTRVDARGHFLSNFLSHHVGRVQRREASERLANMERVFYQLWHGGRSLRFNLSLNAHLLAPGILTERRYGGLEGAHIGPTASSHCHFLGEVWDEEAVKGRAAISTCDGLVSN